MTIAIYINPFPADKNNWQRKDWFAYETLKRIFDAHPRHEFIIISDESFDQSSFQSENLKYVSLESSRSSKFTLYRLLNWKLPASLKKEKAEVLFSMTGFLPIKSEVSSCLMVQDISFLSGSEAVSDKKLNYLKAHFQAYLSKANSIITVSDHCKKKLVSTFKVSEENITVVHKGIHEDFRPLTWQEREEIKNEYTDGREYFIYAGKISKDKNIINMLKGFSVLKKRLRSNMILILAGKEDPTYKEFPDLMRSYHFRDDVKRTGPVSPSNMAKLMGAAYALINPSAKESYSSPVIEALQCKVPVLAAAGSACEELAGDAALYFDPFKPDDIGDKFCEIYKDENLRVRLIANAGNRVNRFSWDKTSTALWDCLLQIVK